MDDSENIENSANVILTTNLRPEDCIIEAPKRKRGTLPDKEIIDLYVNKEISADAIGRIMGVTGHTINRHLENNNIPRRSHSESVPNKIILPEDWIFARLENGEGPYRLAKEYYVNPKTIMRLRQRKEKEYKIKYEKLKYLCDGQLVVSGYQKNQGFLGSRKPKPAG